MLPGNWRSRPRSATASSSSSQSSRESWQPSQEANFQTASFGRGRLHHVKSPGSRRCCATLLVAASPAHPCRRSRGRTGSGRTGRWRISCCAPWKDKCALSLTPALRSALMAYRIMTSGPQIMATVSCGSKAVRRIRDGTTPTLPCQSYVRVIDRHRDIHIEPLAPLFQLMAVKQVAGIAAAVKDGDAAIAIPVGEDVDRSRGAAARGRGRRRRSTTSEPSAASTGQPVPNGPRRPTIAPASSAASAPLTAPTSRTVWTNVPRPPGRR